MYGFRAGLQRVLVAVVVVLMAALAMVVVLGVAFRKAGAPLVWYDEIASILLAWLTYYGSALAALWHAHIGFPKFTEAVPPRFRPALKLLREVAIIGFFLVAAWAGYRVLLVLDGSFLVSLPWVPRLVTQSVIPIGAILFILAELLSIAGNPAELADHEEVPR